jgi:hypothetical protein
VQDGGAKTLVMPLKNGTQKDMGLGPDFRRDDEEKKRYWVPTFVGMTVRFGMMVVSAG